MFSAPMSSDPLFIIGFMAILITAVQWIGSRKLQRDILMAMQQSPNHLWSVGELADKVKLNEYMIIKEVNRLIDRRLVRKLYQGSQPVYKLTEEGVAYT